MPVKFTTIRIFLLLYSLIRMTCVYSANPDSLDRVIAGTKDPLKKSGLLNIAAYYQLGNNPEKALMYNDLCLKAADDEHLEINDSLRLEFMHMRGLYYSRMQQNDTVIILQDYVYREALAAGHDHLAARAIVEKAISEESLGDYKRAHDGYFTALGIFERLGDKKGIMFQSINLGLIYQYQKEYQKAAGFFQRAIAIGKESGNKEGIIIAYNNLGINYQEQQQFDKALLYFTQVLDYDLRSGDSSHIGDSYNNVGVVYQGLKQYAKAERYFLLSLAYKKGYGDMEGYANTCNNLAEVYVITAPGKVLKLLEEARAIAESEGFKAILAENYRVYVAYYKSRGEFRLAYEFQEKYYALKDSLKLDELSIQIEKVQKFYELEKAAKELAYKDTEIAKRVYKERLYFIFFIFFAILGIYMYYSIYRNKQLNRKLRLQQKQIIQQNTILQEQIRETNRARITAEEAANAKSQFLSTMSHEIRTPLNAIIGLANLLDQGDPRADQKENIEILKTSSNNLLSLLNDVLDLSKLEAGKMPVEMVDFDLKRLVDHLCDLYRVKAREKALYFDLVYDQRIPVKLKGDPLHLNQILSNLISNAIKFTHTGGVKVSIEMMSLDKDECGIKFMVADTGIGIPTGKLEAVFESFTQADSKTTRQYGGTGLGLSISKKLLMMLGSVLEVSSEPEKGSIFKFNLNFYTSMGNNETTQDSPKPYGRAFDNVRILIAEDNQINIFVISQFLNKWGIKITVAENGKEAVQAVSDQDYDLILMDLHMPVMDGFEAAREIHKIKPQARIMAITATQENEVRDRIKEAGMIGFIMKPFQPEDLARRLEDALRN